MTRDVVMDAVRRRGPSGDDALPRADRSRWSRTGGKLLSALWFVGVAVVFVGAAAAWTAGWRLERVETTSMDPAVPRGAVAVVAPVDPRVLRPGDVVSFRDPGDRSRRILHRVVKVIEQEDSRVFFRTQGDANPTPDALLVPAADVQGELRWHVPRLGRIAWALRPPFGLIVLGVVPAGAMFASELRRWLRRRGHRARPASRPRAQLGGAIGR